MLDGFLGSIMDRMSVKGVKGIFLKLTKKLRKTPSPLANGNFSSFSHILKFKCLEMINLIYAFIVRTR